MPEFDRADWLRALRTCNDAHVLELLDEGMRQECEKAWDNGVDTAGQYAEQPWVVDDECKPLNPFRKVSP